MDKLCTTDINSELIGLDLIMSFKKLESSFSDLPDEIVTNILNWLPLVDKETCKLACHRWNYIEGNFCNNIKFCVDLDNDSLDHFIISNQIFDVVNMEGLTKRFPRMSHPNNNFPNMKHVQICELNSQAGIMNMLKYGLEYTKSLYIHSDALKFVRRFVISGNIQNFKWNDLNKLELGVGVGEDKRHFELTSTLLKYAKIPNLVQFYFYFGDTDDIKNQNIQIKRLFLNMYMFLFKHSQSLIELKFSIVYYGSSESTYKIPKVEDLKVKNSNGCNNMNIEIYTLYMHGNIRDFGLEYLISPDLIGSNLKSLSLYDYAFGRNEDNVENVLDKFRSVFETNVKSLETVEIVSNATVNLFCLNECNLLKSLNIRVGNLILPEKCVFSHPFQLSIFSRDASCIEYQELLTKIQNKMEHLTLRTFGMDVLEDDSLIWLNSCTALKYLSLRVHNQLLLSNKNVTLPNLIGFDMHFDNSEAEHSQIHNNWIWVKRSMPNLEILKMYGYCNYECLTTSLTCLQIVFTMRKLKKVYFNISRNLLYSSEKLRIMKHCDDTPGLYFKKFYIPVYDHNTLANVIRIDHSIYVFKYLNA